MWRLFPSPFAAHTRTCWAADGGDRKRSSEVKEVSSYDNSQRLTHCYGEGPSNEAFEVVDLTYVGASFHPSVA